VCSSPAIANAIYDAIGIRFHEIPITPEKVLRALNGIDAAGENMAR
jgi:CO/xanthine dehydrogenase Mo-binding subunit